MKNEMTFKYPMLVKGFKSHRNRRLWVKPIIYILIGFAFALVASTAVKADDSVVVGIAPGEEAYVYIPDIDDDCPVSEKVPLSAELQQYIWTQCKKATADYKNYYAFMLGAIQHESSFKSKATHMNNNGTIDRGICQINSSNIGKMKRAGLITEAQDLFNPYKCIDCGFWLMNQYIAMFGVSESAYYAYNTGREKNGSNKNSRMVMSYMEGWKDMLYR